MYKDQLKKISELIYELPKTGKMNVPGVIYMSGKLIKPLEDKAIEQLANIASLKGIQKYALGLADMHTGYGFPIGGVGAFDVKEGIISPGGVGYDINCSVRLLTTNLKVEDFLKQRNKVVDEIFKNVPSGVGRGGKNISKDALKEVLAKGAKWAVENGYGLKDDYIKTEESGCVPAEPNFVSDTAIKRGLPQLGSLGAGNHFLEIQRVDQIFDDKITERFGIKKDNVTIMIHCGSRGLGHQVASDYIKKMEDKYGFADLPDRELINAPIQSELGQEYLHAMGAAANFAFANKQMITHWIRESFNKIFGNVKIDVVYDICHNIAKIEKHVVDGEKKTLCVHRKGATRSFGPGREEIPEIYRSIGQPIIIPGSMGTASYVLVGTKKAEEISFASTAHGAGRLLSRTSALKQFRGDELKASLLKTKNIEIKSGSMKGLAEEAPGAYKDIDEVVNVSHKLGIGNLVVKVKPIAVIKG